MCLPFKELLTIETNRQPKGIVMKGAVIRGEAINTRVVKLQPLKKQPGRGQKVSEGVGRKDGGNADEE
jgi:hypothetical protein